MITLSPAVVDHYVAEDGRSAVMVGTQVAVVSALATVVLKTLLEGPQSLADLAVSVTEALGPPPAGVSAQQPVASAVAALVELGAVHEKFAG